ncbi:unnamed protein product [Nippostrongylus brasiliensis]|uniref:ANF_receptor domain-containing protein n=1 Tax=Nippostrongylus brasiliensis TaxID=27835 RepID=A0A0N4YUC6_NIPBR|nr:unnamed protein product [Nippostrongylus brasiliensis]
MVFSNIQVLVRCSLILIVPVKAKIVGWREVAGGVGVAWDKIISDRILPEYDVLNLTWVMGECVESVDAGAVIDWVQSGADVVIGPACSATAIISGTIGKYFNFPLVIWAPTFSSALLNEFEYPTIMATSFCSINQAQAIVKLLQTYQWTDVAIIDYVSRSSLIPRCSYVFSDLEDILNANTNMNIAYRRQLTAINNATFKTILSAIKDVSRVTVSCFESDLARRNFMVAIAELGMDTDEYVWIMVESRKLGFADAWKDPVIPADGKDAVALRAARRFFIMDVEPLNSTEQFIADVGAKMKEPPFNCDNCTDIDPATSQVGEVADALLLFAIAMNRSLSSGVKAPKGIDLAKSSVGVFEGFTGTVIINRNGSRDPIFYLWGLNSSDQQIVMMKITGTVDLDSVKVSLHEIFGNPKEIFLCQFGSALQSNLRKTSSLISVAEANIDVWMPLAATHTPLLCELNENITRVKSIYTSQKNLVFKKLITSGVVGYRISQLIPQKSCQVT